MTLFEAFILGIIQGLTEFLPVSSSGHIEIGKVVLGVDVTDSLIFSVVVHGATSLSTIIIFRKEIMKLIAGLFQFKYNFETDYILKILISVIPVFILYKLFKDQIESVFTGNMLLVGSMLIVTALLLTFTNFKKAGEKQVGFGGALIIGIAQAIAILPGISRSGATISTSLLLGVGKEESTKFSFLMVLIPIIGGSFLELLDYLGKPVASLGVSAIALIVGFVAAFLSGLFACQLMIKIVNRGKLIYFAVYCLVVGIGAIIYSLSR